MYIFCNLVLFCQFLLCHFAVFTFCPWSAPLFTLVCWTSCIVSLLPRTASDCYSLVYRYLVFHNFFLCVWLCFYHLVHNSAAAPLSWQVCFYPPQNFQALPRQPLQITKKQHIQGELALADTQRHFLQRSRHTMYTCLGHFGVANGQQTNLLKCKHNKGKLILNGQMWTNITTDRANW